MHLTSGSSLLFAATLAAAQSCPGGFPDSVAGPNMTTRITLDDNGRQFLIRLPNNYDGTTGTPVYFSFHGGGKDASQQESLSDLSDDSYNPEGIAVYPEGEETTEGSGKRYWLSHPGIPEASPNDLDFYLDIIDWLDCNICYDTSRVYATGKSNGGGFVNLLACNSTTAGTLAAVAAVSGAYYEDKLAKNCAPGKVMPFLSFHGLNDTTIPYTGKTGDDDDGASKRDTTPDYKKTYPITQWVTAWAKRDGMTSQPKNESLFGGEVIKYTWKNAQEEVVVHYKEDNLGHVWPSLYPNLDCPEPTPVKCPEGHYLYNATTIILDWFKSYTLQA